MTCLSTGDLTALSQEELLETEGGGLLTNLTTGITTGLTPGIVQLLGTVYNVSGITSAFLKTLLGTIV
ncbi:hypothetical protein [Chitinophaga sp. GbtcB8]|jgi:hypothetical protein|uniref:hypothetical protein n=1 Tax=Chitinophaga sp. GbtcB8 TaxID=2824753 RepID=UPI001C310BC1|nr:hypothetical protein [Chitinophaga sp. GbtcB8]